MKDFGLKWQNRSLEFNPQSTVPNFLHCALARVDSWPAPSLLLLLLFLLFCCFPERRASFPLYPTSLCSFADSAPSHKCASDTMLWLEVFFSSFLNIFSPVCVCVWSILFAGWSWGVREGQDVVVCEWSEGGRRLLLLPKVVEKMARSKTLALASSSSSSWPRLLHPSYYLRRPRRLLLLLVLFVGTTFVLWDRHSLVQHHQVSFCFVFLPSFSSLLTWWSLCFLFVVYLCLYMLLLDSIAK